MTLKPRCSSLNPLIYPSWWGDDAKDFKKAILRKEKSQVTTNVRRVNVPQKRTKEDSLERRMREARQQAAQDVQPPMVMQAPRQQYNRNHLPHNNYISSTSDGSTPNYGYTSNKAAPKYSPLRNGRPGSNNIPMSYAGPPT